MITKEEIEQYKSFHDKLKYICNVWVNTRFGYGYTAYNIEIIEKNVTFSINDYYGGVPQNRFLTLDLISKGLNEVKSHALKAKENEEKEKIDIQNEISKLALSPDVKRYNELTKSSYYEIPFFQHL